MCLFFQWWQILLAAGLLSVLASHLRVHPVFQTLFLVVVMVVVVCECVWCVHAYGVFTGTHLPWPEDDLRCWSSPLTLFDTGSLCLQLCMLSWLVCKLLILKKDLHPVSRLLPIQRSLNVPEIHDGSWEAKDTFSIALSFLGQCIVGCFIWRWGLIPQDWPV